MVLIEHRLQSLSVVFVDDHQVVLVLARVLVIELVECILESRDELLDDVLVDHQVVTGDAGLSGVEESPLCNSQQSVAHIHISVNHRRALPWY